VIESLQSKFFVFQTLERLWAHLDNLQVTVQTCLLHFNFVVRIRRAQIEKLGREICLILLGFGDGLVFLAFRRISF